MNENNDILPPVGLGSGEETVLGILIAVLVLIGLAIWLARFVENFSKELRYLNMEIGRTEGRERMHYLRRRRRLWLSLIPFVKYQN
jgi:hypothetical protein